MAALLNSKGGAIARVSRDDAAPRDRAKSLEDAPQGGNKVTVRF